MQRQQKLKKNKTVKTKCITSDLSMMKRTTEKMKEKTEEGREGKKEQECRRELREIKSECYVDATTKRQRKETMQNNVLRNQLL